jgi:hypothetical protein
MFNRLAKAYCRPEDAIKHKELGISSKPCYYYHDYMTLSETINQFLNTFRTNHVLSTFIPDKRTIDMPLSFKDFFNNINEYKYITNETKGFIDEARTHLMVEWAYLRYFASKLSRNCDDLFSSDLIPAKELLDKIKHSIDLFAISLQWE